MEGPGKIKHFLWRVAHNSHALRVNLQHRGMDLNTKCLFCQRVDEDGGHLYFKCKEVKQLWRQLNMEKQRTDLAGIETAREVVEYILAAKEELKMTMAVTMWTWWTERNRIREGEKQRLPANIAHGILVYTAELARTFRKQRKQGESRQQLMRWEKPPVGVLKINCDASFSHAGRNGGWGFIIRDEDGDVVSAGRGRVNHLLDSFQAEVIACLQGVQAAIELGIGNAIVETDAIQVWQACTSTMFDLSSVGSLISELRSLLESNFISFKFAYVPRNCNKVADALASLGCERAVGVDPILGSLPVCLLNLIANDLAPDE